MYLAGPLCLRERKGFDRRLDDNFLSFKEFNKSLDMRCEPGKLKQIFKFYGCLNKSINYFLF